MPLSDQSLAHALIAAQKQSLELIVTGAPLHEVLTHLTRTVEEQAGGNAVAAIMLLDGECRLRSAAAPSLPTDYLLAIDGLPANPTLGTCCTAAATGQVVVTPDFATAPGWRGLSHLPTALGLYGAWSMPIRARDGSVLGTFGTYFRERREPTALEREIVEVLARTAAIAIERDRDEQARCSSIAELHNAKEAAEAASRTKSQFLAVMSHELRTPLAGIVGYADLLASDIGGKLTDVQRMHVARITAGAWHLLSIINEILTFSRVEAGKEQTELERVDLRALVDDSVELLKPQAAAKGVELRYVAPAVGQATLTTDAGKVRQVLLNLIGNALKFTDTGFVEVVVSRENGHARVVVRDTGPGISAEDRERIFEPFVQADQSSTRHKGGTGLGLTVSRRLAQMLGGNVAIVDSVPGQGSTFEAIFPNQDA